MKDLVRLDLKIATIDEHGLNASVIATDGPFGNLVTNVDGSDFLTLGYQRGQEVSVKVGDKELKMKFVKTFSDVLVGDSLLYIDSRGHQSPEPEDFARPRGSGLPAAGDSAGGAVGLRQQVRSFRSRTKASALRARPMSVDETRGRTARSNDSKVDLTRSPVSITSACESGWSRIPAAMFVTQEMASTLSPM